MFGLLTFFSLLLLLAIGTWRHPPVGFAAVLCLYGLKQWGLNTTSFLVAHDTVANLAVAALVLTGLLRLRAGESRLKWYTPSTTWLLGVGIYCYALLTLIWGPDLHGALEVWQREVPYILLIAIAAPFLVRTYHDVESICDWTVLAGGTLCALALLFGKWGPRGLLITGDLFSAFANPLAIASLGGTVAVIALLSIMRKNWWGKILCALTIPFALAVVIRSESRGQLIAAGLASLIGIPLSSPPGRQLRTWIALAISMTALYLLGTLAWQYLHVDSNRWSAELAQSDAQGRVDSAVTLLRTASTSPFSLIFGLGNSSSYFYLGIYPHIAPAEVLGEEGLVGMMIYLCLIITACSSIARLKGMADQSSGSSGRFACGVIAALFVFEFILTTKEGTLLSSVYAVAYASILGRLLQWSKTTELVPSASDSVVPKGEAFPNLLR